MKIIGIDPGSAGANGSALVEISKIQGVWTADLKPRVDHASLRVLIKKWGEPKQNVLVVWDAPLTGPRDSENENAGSGLDTCYGGNAKTWLSDFTMRGIEQRLLSGATVDGNHIEGLRDVPGISIMGYASCPHMAISRNLLGYPILGPYDDGKPVPLNLITGGPASISGPSVVETHPAVAMWAWLVDGPAPEGIHEDNRWLYKAQRNGWTAEDRRNLRSALLKQLRAKWDKDYFLNKLALVSTRRPPREETPEELIVRDDNVFDALIAAVLGWCFVQSKGAKIYGNQMDGAMLLPAVEVLDNLLDQPKLEG